MTPFSRVETVWEKAAQLICHSASSKSANLKKHLSSLLSWYYENLILQEKHNLFKWKIFVDTSFHQNEKTNYVKSWKEGNCTLAFMPKVNDIT